MKLIAPSLLIGAITTIALTLVVPAADAPGAGAEALPKAFKLENRAWYRMWYVQFKPTKSDQARKLVERVAQAAAEAYSTLPIVLSLETGRWHLLTIMKVRDGAQGLDWLQSPEDEKFWQVLARQEGGANKALALWEELMDCVQDQQFDLATKLDIAKP